MKSKLLMGIACGVLIFTACKKGDSGGSTPPVRDKIKDSAVDIARDIYLWYNQIPSSFDGQSYADPDKIMTALRQYSKEPGFTNPVDRWSFAYLQSEWDNVSSGVSQDMGFSVFFLAEGDLRVKYVDKNSPAFNAGIRRGWRVTKINGSTNITTSNANFIVNAIFNSASGNFTFTKPDNSTVDITLNGATYQSDPFLLDTVYTVGASKVGYVVFNSFLGDTTAINNKLASVFNKFSTQSVADVVVDLRYNGGGYVSVQERFADYLAPNAANGQVMMSEKFNDKYSLYNSTSNFSKKGSLNLSRVFFIVSNNTASASELLINNLRPYMTVKIVGPQATYGKPVGFFPIPVGTWYVFPVSFRSTNKSGEGNYFNGFTPDKIVADGLDKDWGDINESSLASIIKYIGTGTFGFVPETIGQANNSVKTKEAIETANSRLGAKAFRGTVEKRKF